MFQEKTNFLRYKPVEEMYTSTCNLERSDMESCAVIEMAFEKFI